MSPSSAAAAASEHAPLLDSAATRLVKICLQPEKPFIFYHDVLNVFVTE